MWPTGKPGLCVFTPVLIAQRVKTLSPCFDSSRMRSAVSGRSAMRTERIACGLIAELDRRIPAHPAVEQLRHFPYDFDIVAATADILTTQNGRNPRQEIRRQFCCISCK